MSIATPTGRYATAKITPTMMGNAINPTLTNTAIPNRARLLFADFFDGSSLRFIFPTTLRFHV
jgi:hypothetical protein